MSEQKEHVILEINKQNSALSMALYDARDSFSTLRHYSQLHCAFAAIENVYQEISILLRRQSRSQAQEIEASKELKKAGQFLWDHLLTKSVKERLEGCREADLTLCLDEEVIFIPWELLYSGEEFLCLAHNVGRVIKTKHSVSTPRYREQKESVNMLILANPTNDLPSAYREGLKIKNAFDQHRSRFSIDFKSTLIDTLFVKKYLRDYDIVHFAGHCEYNRKHPEKSGWVLSDGAFTVHDIAALGETLSLPSLVFSNACLSAQVPQGSMDSGGQEKTFGVASAFLYAGVRHYIGSIQRIEDEASLVFAKAFYAQLLVGKSMGACVRSARRVLIEKRGVLSACWASYLLYGDPHYSFFRTQPRLGRAKKALVSSYKKWLIAALTFIFLCGATVAVTAWLPSVHPSTFFLHYKSQRLFLAGKNTQAIAHAQRIIQKDPLFLAAYPLLADASRRLGDKSEALRYYFAYIRASERRNDQHHLSAAYIALGWFYYLNGEYPKAGEFYQKALTLTQQSHDTLHQADVLGKLALLDLDKKNFDAALLLLTKSSEINRQYQHNEKYRYNLACDYFNLALLFSEKDDLVTAREFYDKSFTLFNNLKLTHELSDYYFNIGEMYVFQKEYQKALDCYGKGLAIDSIQGNLPSIAADYNMFGELYLKMEDCSQAESYFIKAMVLARSIDALPELASAYYNLGLVHKTNGKTNEARQHFQEAQQVFRHLDDARFREVQEELANLKNY